MRWKKIKKFAFRQNFEFHLCHLLLFDLRNIKYCLLKNGFCGTVLIIYNLFKFFFPLQSPLIKVISFKHQVFKKANMRINQDDRFKKKKKRPGSSDTFSYSTTLIPG